MSGERRQPENMYGVAEGALLAGRRKLGISRSIVKFLRMGIISTGRICEDIEEDTINLVEVIEEQLEEANAHYLAYEEGRAAMRREGRREDGSK